MGRKIFLKIAAAMLGGVFASGCASLSSQSDAKFPGFHTADGITLALVERVTVLRESSTRSGLTDDLADSRYAREYYPADYGLMTHLYGPYQHLSWRERHWLEYQRRLAHMGYGPYYDPFYDPFYYGGNYNPYGYWGYDPWGWGNNYYGYYDPFYYSNRYRGGYAYSHSGYYYSGYPYYVYGQSYGGTSSKTATTRTRRSRNRKDYAGGSLGSRIFGNKSYAETRVRSGSSSKGSTGARTSNRGGGKSVKSSSGKSSSKAAKPSKSTSKTKSRTSKRKD